jgi:outer membrane receptor protein involved in Fe transport
MMKKLLSSLFLLLIIPIATLAQSDGTITGTVLDEQEEPLSSASVAVYDSEETNVITGASASADGSFSIDISPGTYVLKITYVSYQDRTEEVQISEGETVDLGSVTMAPSSENLGEVVVQGEKSQMEMSFDRRVFNVGQDITSLGGSAVNVLDNVPSVATDIDGNISLRGNESVRILINGKPSSMVGDGNVDALRSIPATMIESVEIITNPSSKYAAEGSGGIINIKLKEDRNLGLNGSASVGVGYPEEYEGSINLNYRTPNVNWFADIGGDYRSGPEEGYAFERFKNNDTGNSYMYEEDTDATESEIDGDIRLGADFYLSDSEILTTSTFINLEKEENEEDVYNTDYFYAPGATEESVTSGMIDEEYLRENIEEGDESDFDFNIDYENKIDGDDHKLVADASFDISSENAETDITEIGAADNIRLQQQSEDIEEEQDLRVNVEYVRPVGEEGKFEAGIRTDTEWMDTGYHARTYDPQTDQWQEEAAYNDNFLYRENVNAAYAILGGERGSFSGQVGLRLENTRIRTEVKGTGEVSDQNYLNLFPTVFLNYSFNEQQSVQVSYSRRLRRPWSRMLLPIRNIEDPRTQRIGNPNLTPEFSNSYEAGYLHYWETGSLLTSFYYRHRTDVIERITQSQDSQGTEGTITRPINLATEKAWGVEFSADQEFFNDLTLTANANFYRSESDGSYQEQVFDSESENISARSRLRWKLTEGLNLQTSLRYRGPRENAQGRSDGMTMMDAGVAYDLLDEKAKLSLNIRDIFDSRQYNNTVTTDGNPNTDFYTHREFSWSSRSFSLNFQYFFGNQENKRGGGQRGGGPR